MIAPVIRRVVKAAAGVFVATALFSGAVQAQTVAQFAANPAAVIAQFPNGGPQLISLVRDAVTQNPSLLQAVIAAMGGASADAQAAVGSGLGQAAQIAANNNNPALANQISAAVAASGVPNAQTAFSGATGNTQTAATGAGAGGGGGGGGGSGGPAGGSGSGFGGGAPSGASNSGGTTTGSGGASTQTSSSTFTGGGGSSSSGSSVSPR